MIDQQPGDLATLIEMIRSIRVAILTTLNEKAEFHARPVQTHGADVSGLWFFTDAQSGKAQELQHDERVSLGYADPARRRYATVSGTAAVLRDPDKARELWSIEQLAYYPDGPQDHRLAVLRVNIERAEYWIAPGRTSYLLAAARSAATGAPAGVIGENRKLTRNGH